MITLFGIDLALLLQKQIQSVGSDNPLYRHWLTGKNLAPADSRNCDHERALRLQLRKVKSRWATVGLDHFVVSISSAPALADAGRRTSEQNKERQKYHGVLQLKITAKETRPGELFESRVLAFWKDLVGSFRPVMLYPVNTFRIGPKGSLVSVPGNDPGPNCTDWHTGVGELIMVHRLTALLSEIGRTPDCEAASAKVSHPFRIWFGSPFVNPTVEDLFPYRHWKFIASSRLRLAWSKRPKRQESHDLKRVHPNGTNGVDFAVLCVNRYAGGVDILAAGLTPYGTAAAALCLTDGGLLAKIEKQLNPGHRSNHFPACSFEAFVKVRVQRSAVLARNVEILDAYPFPVHDRKVRRAP